MLILTIKIPEITSYCGWPLTGFISVCALIFCTGCLKSLGRRAREWADFLSLLVSLVEMPSVQTLMGNCSSFTLVFAHCTTRTSCLLFFTVNNTDRLVNFCQNWYVRMWWTCDRGKKHKKRKEKHRMLTLFKLCIHRICTEYYIFIVLAYFSDL